MTANWQAEGNGPCRSAAAPVDLAVGAYYNVGRPDFGARWQLSTTLTLVF